MTQKDNILQELNELGSSVGKAAGRPTYQVPVGYFEGLADQVMKRVRALDAGTALEELAHLSPLLSRIPKSNPYSVPAGFFETLALRAEEVANDPGELNAAEELRTLSPLLGGLKKDMPYAVPAGYFEGVRTMRNRPAKVVSMRQPRWFRYAAAAAIVSAVAVFAFLLLNRSRLIDPQSQTFAWAKYNLKNVSTDDINKFVELADETKASIAKTDNNEADEIKELMKDVPDKDIQKFLDDTQSTETDNADDLLLN